MNSTRIIIFALVAFGILFVLAMPDPQVSNKIDNMQLPWQIKTYDDGSSEVFSTRLGVSSLESLTTQFNDPEDIALYQGKEKLSLEAYFSSIKIGLLEARLVATLDASQEQLLEMLKRAKGIAMTSSADRKVEIANEDIPRILQLPVASLSFIPKYRKLDSAFFKERFGEPAAWQRIDENTVNYFYPDKGLSILIDAEGSEVLEYSRPDRFILPPQVESASSAEHK